VFLVLPGLNLAPAKLGPLQDFLLDRGHAVARPALTGYAPGDPEAWGRVRAGDWLADLDRAAAEIRQCLPGAAVSLLGVSMGALLGLTWSLTRREPLRRAILLAPALQLKWHLTSPLRVLGAALPGRLRLPSLGPAEYLAHRGTSLAAYMALLNLLKTFHAAMGSLDGTGAAGIPPPQFLAYSPRDELLSMRYLARYSALAPERTRVHALAHRPLRGGAHHLGIDAHTLGDSEWAALLGALASWLER
jgi:pimeloyl-ACP methyl ester carboxylesterase